MGTARSRVYSEDLDDAQLTILIQTLFRSIRCHGNPALHLLQELHDINVSDSWGTTSCHVSAEWGNLGCLSYVLQHGCYVDSTDDARQTPLHLAAARGNKECVRLLVHGQACLDIQDNWGYTPLHRAIINHHYNTAHLLLRYGCTVNSPDDLQRVPLHVAASYGHSPLLASLLSHGATRDAQDRRGLTPLHLAVIGRHAHIIQDLSCAGSDLNLPAANGMSPLDLAVQRGHGDCVGVLLQLGAKCSNSRSRGGNPVPLETLLLKLPAADSTTNPDRWAELADIASRLIQADGQAPSPQLFFLALRNVGSLCTHTPSILAGHILRTLHLVCAAGATPQLQHVQELIDGLPHGPTPCSGMDAGDLHDLVDSWVEHYLRTPSLKDLCRWQLRHTIHSHTGNVTTALEGEDIPHLLKRLLILADVPLCS